MGDANGTPPGARRDLRLRRAAHGLDLQLTRYGTEGWRATVFPAGIAHSMTTAVGTGWKPTPARAVQAAVWATLVRAEGVG